MMKLAAVETGDFDSVRSLDAVVAAAGWEPRSIAIVKASRSIKARRRVSLCFSMDELDQHTQFNRNHFAERGFELLECAGGSGSEVSQFATAILTDGAREILVDISSMTRTWYAALIRTVRSFEGEVILRIHFCYFPGIYPATHVTDAPNEVFGPLRGFSGLEPPRLPIALLLGLGFDVARADSLIHRLEPKRVTAFVHEPVSRSGTESARDALEEDGTDFRFRFPVGAFEIQNLPLHDPGSAFYEIESTVAGLEGEFRIVGCSLGPKLLGLVLLLVSSVRPALGVWRVSSGAHGRPSLVKPARKKPYVCSTLWKAE